MAADNIEFLGRVSDAELRELYARCRAFLMPGEEDFGMTPVEALASGKPVIALAHGGALETVPAFGGILYDGPTGLPAAIEQLDVFEATMRPAELQAWASQFSPQDFARRMSALLTVDTPARTPDGVRR